MQSRGRAHAMRGSRASHSASGLQRGDAPQQLSPLLQVSLPHGKRSGILLQKPRRHVVPGVRQGEPSIHSSPNSQGERPDDTGGSHSATVPPENRNCSQQISCALQSTLSSQRAIPLSDQPRGNFTASQRSHCALKKPIAPCGPSGSVATHTPSSEARQQVSVPDWQVVFPQPSTAGSDFAGAVPASSGALVTLAATLGVGVATGVAGGTETADVAGAVSRAGVRAQPSVMAADA